MTLEDNSGEHTSERMESVAQALEEVLSAALPQGCVTVGVYEAAKSLNADSDNVVLCVLASDDGDQQDVALQIHFTLIRAFCCDNHIDIVHVANTRRLAELVGGAKAAGEPLDPHCVLVTVKPADLVLEELGAWEAPKVLRGQPALGPVGSDGPPAGPMKSAPLVKVCSVDLGLFGREAGSWTGSGRS
ncbi:growth arrest and DNA damage-inducible protein GADD45 alpha-like isoform X1 [Nerophis ophidion]|uniref:growth arrest and DNA damage-inducible protein GADD45 alpha-like isoform X1 n=1 Tax=Nerophis ophidion TaxID=159077 RepID=UPI002ADF04B9|nr:growth arrest and DNA damage-inducible protein GADD45 alpha-like isoform X1 [Nerophis ophidion]